MTTPKFNQSTLTFDEYIRLNNITEDQILEASDTLVEQEKEIEQLKEIIHSFDFDTINAELDKIPYENTPYGTLANLYKMINNYKLRTEDI